jgi:hypothetical protein
MHGQNHIKQAIRSAINTSVASSWNFISTYSKGTFENSKLFMGCKPVFNSTVMSYIFRNKLFYTNKLKD